MDPLLISSLGSVVSSAIRNSLPFDVTNLVADFYKNADKKLSLVKEEYQATGKDLNAPGEEERRRLLKELGDLQLKARRYISHDQVLIVITPALLDQAAQIYEARGEANLKLIDISLEPIRGVVKQYEDTARHRSLVRWLAVITSVIALLILGSIMIWGTSAAGLSVNTVVPLIQIPLPILLWSAIGSFTAILYRFNNSGDIELQEPLRWLITRPLTGLIMGVVSYFVILIGLLSIGAGNASPTAGKTEILWLVAFISGFSDRFADGLLDLLVGHFGGNTKAGLLKSDPSPSTNIPSPSLVESLSTHLNEVNKWIEDHHKRRGGSKPAGQSVENTDPHKQEDLASLDIISRGEDSTINGNTPLEGPDPTDLLVKTVTEQVIAKFKEWRENRQDEVDQHSQS